GGGSLRGHHPSAAAHHRGAVDSSQRRTAGRFPPDEFDRQKRDGYVAAFRTDLRAEPTSPASVGRHPTSLSAGESPRSSGIAPIQPHPPLLVVSAGRSGVWLCRSRVEVLTT